MRIFFDVDYTILSCDRFLRPGTAELFERLAGEGHELFVWSGSGVEWASDVVETHGLSRFVSGVYEKPYELSVAGLPAIGVTAPPDFVVDDHSAVVEAFGGFAVRCYYYADRYATGPDHDLLRAYEAISAHVSSVGAIDHA